MKFIDYRIGALASVATVIAGMTLAPGAATATSLTFQGCTSNSAGDVTIGETQMSVDLMDAGGNQVKFTFNNAGPEASSITDIYFEDGILLEVAQLIDADDGVGGDAGVDFSIGSSPGNLPGSTNCPGGEFVATAGFTMDSDPPVEANGVNPGEMFSITFDILTGKDFDDVVVELANGNLRIGIHVQGFADGESESFVNGPPSSPPPPPSISEPGMLAIFGLGLFGLGYMRRRRGA